MLQEDLRRVGATLSRLSPVSGGTGKCSYAWDERGLCSLWIICSGVISLVISNWLRIRDKMEWFTALKHMGAILDTGNRVIQRLSATSACALLAVSTAQCSWKGKGRVLLLGSACCLPCLQFCISIKGMQLVFLPLLCALVLIPGQIPYQFSVSKHRHYLPLWLYSAQLRGNLIPDQTLNFLEN